ncbi:MAG TPA: hypothetical protein VGO68_13290 [Pyrinomonadaceae bacterium]|jgi:hypothetical protein|nr:hypothetical protein [Pyrinomonadaceae bacterium]
MSSANVIVPADISKLIIEREKVWGEFDRAQGLVGELKQLSQHIPNCAPAELHLQFAAGAIPTTELETVLPMVKEKINVSARLKSEVKSCYEEIESIKRAQKKLIVGLAVGGAVVLLILVIVLISVLASFSS